MKNQRKADVLEELPDMEKLRKRMKQDHEELIKLRQLLTETYHKIALLETKVQTAAKELSDFEDSTSNNNTKNDSIRDADQNKEENSDCDEDDELEESSIGFITV